MIGEIPHAATHSSLDVYEKPSVLVNFDGGFVQEVFPSGSLDGPNLEFILETDRNLYLDLQNIYLDVKVKIIQAGSKPLLTADNGKVKFVNNTLQSLFSNCDVKFNNTLVYSSNGLYAHMAMMATEMSHTIGTKQCFSYCQGYTYEDDPGTLTGTAFTSRAGQTDGSASLHLYGKMPIDVFNCDKLLVPNTHVRISMIKSNPDFHFIATAADASGKGYKVQFLKASLHVRQMTVSESVHRSLTNTWANTPARYTFPEVKSKTFIIQAGQNQLIRENIFSNEPIRRIAIAMNKNADFTGSIKTNPFHYQKFGLRDLRIVRGGQTIISMNTTDDVVPYFHTIKSLNFDQDGPGIDLNDFPNHYILVFDLTSTLQADTDVYYPEVVGAAIRLELFFDTTLTDTVELIVLGEKLSTVFIHQDGRVIKDGQ